MPKQWKVPDAPGLTIKADHEGKDWFNKAEEFTLPGEKGSKVNIPVINANLFVQKKKSARYLYTINVNKMLETLTTALGNPGSQGSQQLMIQRMEALSLRRGLLEKLESEAWTISMLITPESLKNDQKAVAKRNKRDDLQYQNYLSVITW
jgi:hypothetical protein